MTGDDDPVDPGSAATLADLGQRLRTLRRRAGLSQSRLAARSAVSTSTISAIEKGQRVPRPDNLRRLLDGCGVEQAAQLRWLDALDRVAEGCGTPTAVAPPPPDPAPRRRTRWWWAAAAALLVAAVVAGAVLLTRPRLALDMRCEPANCVAPAKDLTVVGHLTGDLPAGQEAWLLLRVDNVDRWYLGEALVPDRGAPEGTWTRTFTIGNTPSQAKDRHLTVCAYLLPSSGIAPLTQLLVSRHGDGVAPAELPEGRRELACVAAVRAAGT